MTSFTITWHLEQPNGTNDRCRPQLLDSSTFEVLSLHPLLPYKSLSNRTTLARGRPKCQCVGQSGLESRLKDPHSKCHKQQHHKLTMGHACSHEDLEFWQQGQKIS